ncbi:FtsX-like permease family protein [Streptosporangium sp. NPDC002544]|uniref:ABC transporter permease n=1 Tax=Streptosporangium sp. NPDC002544 TaxID=3154538 RepID=UPI00332E320F
MLAKLTLRNLLAHRVRLLLSVLAVTLGVSFVAGTMIFRDTATQSFDPIFAGRTETTTVVVRPKPAEGENATPATIPASLVGTLQQSVPGAAELRGQYDGYAALVRQDGRIVGEDRAAHLGAAYVERPGAGLQILSGREPSAADDVVVEERTAAEGQLKVGDPVSVVTARATKSMRVAGVFRAVNDQVGRAATYVMFAPETAQALLTGPGQYSAIFVRPREGVSQQQLLQQVGAALPAQYEAKTGADEVEEVKSQLSSLFELISRFLLVFAGVAVFIGSFIILNTFTMLVVQRIRELALLRAMGASRAQVTRAVLGEALGIGFLGSTLGLLAGVGLSYGLRLLFERFTGGTQVPLRTPVVGPSTVIWAYAVGMLVTLLAAYLPTRRAAKIPPVAAMRDDVALTRRSMTLRLVAGVVMALLGAGALAAGLATGKAGGAALVIGGGLLALLALTMLSPFLSRPVIALLGWPISRLGGTVGRLSRENARRDPRRTAATASALMVGLALVSVATVVAGSMSASADQRIARQFGADLSLDPRGLTGFSQETVDRVAAVPGVRGVTAVRHGTMGIAGGQVPVLVADPVALAGPANLKIEDGTGTLAADGLLVQSALAAERGWKVGSTVTGRYPDRSTATLRVSGLFAANEVLGMSFVVSPAGYQAHAPAGLIQKAFVDLDDGGEEQALAAVRSALRAYPNVELKDREAVRADARQEIDQVLNLIVVLLVLSIAIAALGIVNTLSLSVMERTREIGLLRAVGMSRGQTRSMISYESVMVSLFGAVAGLALGTALGWAVQRVMAADGVEVLDIPYGRLGLYLLSAVLIGVVAAIWPARRASRMNVLRAIQHQ